MKLNRQYQGQTSAKAPLSTSSKEYGRPHCDIEGRIYVTDKNGNPVSLCSTADNAKLVNGFNVETAVPSNAVFVDHSYSFSTGDTNGTFKVIPSVNGPSTGNINSYNVSIKGLGSAAYQSTSFFIPASSASNLATKADLQKVDAVTLGGSSLAQIIAYIDKRNNPFG